MENKLRRKCQFDGCKKVATVSPSGDSFCLSHKSNQTQVRCCQCKRFFVPSDPRGKHVCPDCKPVSLTNLETELRNLAKKSNNAAAFLNVLKSLSEDEQYELDNLHEQFTTALNAKLKGRRVQSLGAVSVMELFCKLIFRTDDEKRREFARLYEMR